MLGTGPIKSTIQRLHELPGWPWGAEQNRLVSEHPVSLDEPVLSFTQRDVFAAGGVGAGVGAGVRSTHSHFNGGGRSMQTWVSALQSFKEGSAHSLTCIQTLPGLSLGVMSL